LREQLREAFEVLEKLLVVDFDEQGLMGEDGLRVLTAAYVMHQD